jgi:hypothetical protein
MNLDFSTSVLAFFIFPSSYSSWDKADIIGPTLVLVGIIWEFKLLLSRLPDGATRQVMDRKHVKEILAALIVVLGVTIELVVVPHTLLEVSNVKQRTEELRAANDALELKIQPRTITKIQETNFIWLCKFIPKIPVTVRVISPKNENLSYAYQIRALLSKAGFGTNAGANDLGIVEDLRITPYRKKISAGWEIDFVTSDQNASNHFAGTPFFTTNGFNMPITTNSDEVSVFLAIGNIFKQIDIPSDFSGDFPGFTPGHWEIVVSPRDL